MRFYRPLGRISALTFDLDDTLYDNRPVILRTEREALTFVQNYHPALRSFQNEDLQGIRNDITHGRDYKEIEWNEIDKVNSILILMVKRAVEVKD